ncbi:glycosyl-transferase for dystroglycan-domain-containing protein [Dunaliella salina]|uniref:Glycosyl-transferase for dystroglycan-domain-containing protein n=1 Tax=Dunaliella salina TaxID=3046 RepID=A0ABQ7FWH3_DUNSA|nr:glycosyl-transferase for dystroglycan-domain-containing protein [Dunaliella salina]|eukprot:KAF5826710.1 glycosyl-transferase for dystroglycan-domain-containing protein [Dunaliella salina]
MYKSSIIFLFLFGANLAREGADLFSCLNDDIHIKKTSWNESMHSDVEAKSFRGPVSAAVHVSIVQPESIPGLSNDSIEALVRAEAIFADVFERAELLHGCQLTIMLFYEIFDSHLSSLLYPINAMRNFARMPVKTELVSAIDVDMVISRSLSTHLLDPMFRNWLKVETVKRRAFVLPAFEPGCPGMSSRTVTMLASLVNKSQLMGLYHQGSVTQFKGHVFPPGHGPTNYEKWMCANETYKVSWQGNYEPWFISHWDVLPWFDVRYKGFGQNKISFLANVNQSGFSFEPLPDIWLTHLYHRATESSDLVKNNQMNIGSDVLRGNDMKMKVEALYRSQRIEMMQGTYVPKLDSRMLKCFEKLHWLQPLEPSTRKTVHQPLLQSTCPCKHSKYDHFSLHV